MKGPPEHLGPATPYDSVTDPPPPREIHEPPPGSRGQLTTNEENIENLVVCAAIVGHPLRVDPMHTRQPMLARGRVAFRFRTLRLVFNQQSFLTWQGVRFHPLHYIPVLIQLAGPRTPRIRFGTIRYAAPLFGMTAAQSK